MAPVPFDVYLTTPGGGEHVSGITGSRTLQGPNVLLRPLLDPPRSWRWLVKSNVQGRCVISRNSKRGLLGSMPGRGREGMITTGRERDTEYSKVTDIE